MAILPLRHNSRVEEYIEDKKFLKEQRPYLGMSGVGTECMREPWFNWRWVKEIFITKRQDRLFNRGHMEEPRVIADLEEIGIVVTDTQLELVHITKHSLGHIDGIAANIPDAPKTEHLLEVKTMADKYYTALMKNIKLLTFPVALQAEHSTYWVQVQLYMGYIKLKRCLYVIANKNTEARAYFRLDFDKVAFEKADKRIMDILTSETPPLRISERPDWYLCRMCDFKSVCFGEVKADKNCRTCKNVNLLDEGVWACGLDQDRQLTVKEQKAGCDKHIFIEGL